MGVFRCAYRNGLTGQVYIFLRDHIAAVQRKVFTGAQRDIAPGAAQGTALVLLAVAVRRLCQGTCSDGKPDAPGAHQSAIFLCAQVGFVTHLIRGGDGDIFSRAGAQVAVRNHLAALGREVISGTQGNGVATELAAGRPLVLYLVMGFQRRRRKETFAVLSAVFNQIGRHRPGV